MNKLEPETIIAATLAYVRAFTTLEQRYALPVMPGPYATKAAYKAALGCGLGKQKAQRLAFRINRYAYDVLAAYAEGSGYE